MNRDFSRSLVLVVGDFRRSAEEVLALRALGVRVFTAGIATARERKPFEAAGVAVSGLVRSRRAVMEAALDGMGGCDATLITAPGWDAEFEALREAESETAAIDGRGMRPILRGDDPRYHFLKAPAEWAAFTAALASGAGFDSAKEFVTRQSRGYKKQNTGTGRGGRSRVGTRAKGGGLARGDRTLRPARGRTRTPAR